MTVRLAHYWLDCDGALHMAPPATRGLATPYLTQRDGRLFLNVIEGAAFHSYEIAPAAAARLGAESASFFWQRERAA